MLNKLGTLLDYVRRVSKLQYDKMEARLQPWPSPFDGLNETIPPYEVVIDKKAGYDSILKAAKKCKKLRIARLHYSLAPKEQLESEKDKRNLEKNLRWAMEFCFQNEIEISTEAGLTPLQSLEVYQKTPKVRESNR